MLYGINLDFKELLGLNLFSLDTYRLFLFMIVAYVVHLGCSVPVFKMRLLTEVLSPYDLRVGGTLSPSALSYSF